MSLVAQLPQLECVPRLYVAEMIIVRVFAMFEAVVQGASCGLVCGAVYCDGSKSLLQRSRPTRGTVRALDAMRHFGRSTPRKLRWGKASEIKKNLEFLFPANEHLVNVLAGHGQFISDLRKVRNHIAHKNIETRGQFDEVVSNVYGASVNGMTPGKMLLSSRFKPMVIERYCRQAQIVLLAAIRAK